MGRLSYDDALREEQPREPTMSPEGPGASAFERELRDSRYLGVLESYLQRSPWTRERVARDVWQNFFDSNQFTTEGIALDRRDEDGEGSVTLSSNAEYPYTRLLAFGGGFKEDADRSAGGHHEGTRIVALHLLRDYGCDEVVFRSGDWELTFTLDEPPEGSVDRDVAGDQRGLFARLSTMDDPIEGNEVEIRTRDAAMATALHDARDLFYRADHPDFQHPDVETSHGGIRILGKDEQGCVYLNGQRMHVESTAAWRTLPGFTIWTTSTPDVGGRRLVPGRDRQMISIDDVRDMIVPFLVKSMEPEDQRLLLASLEEYYSIEGEYQSGTAVGVAAVRELAAELMRRGEEMDFPAAFLANDIPYEQQQMFSALGYTVSLGQLARVGMVRASEALATIEELHAVEPSPEEEARLEMLSGVVKRFLKVTFQGAHRESRVVEDQHHTGQRKRFSDVQVKAIALFEGRHPYTTGVYDGQQVWMKRSLLASEHVDAVLATYLHELCHAFGSDNSPEFSYALTAMLARWTRFVREHPQELQGLQDEWESITLTQEWTSVAEAELDITKVVHERYHTFDMESPETYGLGFSEQEALMNFHALLDASEVGARCISLQRLYEDILQHPINVQIRVELDKPAMSAELNEQADRERKDIRSLESEYNEVEHALLRREHVVREGISSGDMAHHEERILARDSEVRSLRAKRKKFRREIRLRKEAYDVLRSGWQDDEMLLRGFRSRSRASLYGTTIDLDLVTPQHEWRFATASLECLIQSALEADDEAAAEEVRPWVRWLHDRARDPQVVERAAAGALLRVLDRLREQPSPTLLHVARTLYETIEE
jgi:hypothetical protein